MQRNALHNNFVKYILSTISSENFCNNIYARICICISRNTEISRILSRIISLDFEQLTDFDVPSLQSRTVHRANLMCKLH
jgi:hypothetical protein